MMRRHRKDMTPMSAMNLTSMLDITFVLLIAFMIVAPTLNSGLEIDLPKVEESEEITPKEPTRISILRRASVEAAPVIKLNDQDVTLSELREALKDLHAVKKDMNILVQGDRHEEFGIYMEVYGAIQGAGFEGFSVETERD